MVAIVAVVAMEAVAMVGKPVSRSTREGIRRKRILNQGALLAGGLVARGKGEGERPIVDGQAQQHNRKRQGL
jgi:hypothetical protein